VGVGAGVRRRDGNICCCAEGPEDRLATPYHLPGALAAHAATAIGVVTESRARGSAVGTLALPTGASSVLRDAPRDSEVRAALAPVRTPTGDRLGRRTFSVLEAFVVTVVVAAAVSCSAPGKDAAPPGDRGPTQWKVTLVTSPGVTPSPTHSRLPRCNPRPYDALPRRSI